MGTLARHVALLACACIVIAPDVVSAQGCTTGRVASETSAGRCCWPGQTWSDADARCDGIPECPDGFGGEGNTCVALAVPAPPRVASAAAALATPYEPVVPVVPVMSTVRPLNNQLVFNGLALALATYGGSLAEALLWGGSISYFLPYGALVGAIQSAFYDGIEAATGFAFGLGQVVATILIVAGSSFWRRQAPTPLAGSGFAITF